MVQTALPFMEGPMPATVRGTRASRPPRPATTDDPCAWDIGWDHARHGLTPPLAHLHPAHPVRAGWQAGQAAFGRRTLHATNAVRLWLDLRLHAWTHGRAFEDFQLTPRFFAHIVVPHCPVTGEHLQVQRSGRPDDLCIARLRPEAGYAAGHLAALSARAVRARAGLGWHEALERAQRIQDGHSGQIDGLGGEEWLRLGLLMSCVAPLPHARAAALPLRVLPPPRLRLLNPVQALQAMLTLQFTGPGYATRVAAIAGLLPAGEPRHAYQVFINTLLARRLQSRVDDTDTRAVAQALERAWADPLLAQRWLRLALRLTPADCERVLRQAAQRGWARGRWRWLDEPAATEGWALATDRLDCAPTIG